MRAKLPPGCLLDYLVRILAAYLEGLRLNQRKIVISKEDLDRFFSLEDPYLGGKGLEVRALKGLLELRSFEDGGREEGVRVLFARVEGREVLH